MGQVGGYLEIERQEAGKQSVMARLQHHHEFTRPLSEEDITEQGARCMNCGVPFCHSYGCPLGNRIPRWNDLVYRGRWEEALLHLHATNNFPEFTGRLCPAPCEAACIVAISDPAVTIKQLELSIVERGWKKRWIKPQPPTIETGKSIAVVGSGPAGLAAAQQLRRAGHSVTVFEKNDRLGGLMRYGIPHFKMEKRLIDRRVMQMEAEGVIFETSVNIGVDITLEKLREDFAAVALCGGAEKPRDLPIPGRDLKGVYFAMEFLPQQNRWNMGDEIPAEEIIFTKDKNVVVIGGGDTGSDCVGTSHRQGANQVTQLELMPQPPIKRPASAPWPLWPGIHKTTHAHEEGGERKFSVNTTSFIDDGNGRLAGLNCVKVEWIKDPDSGRMTFETVAGSEFEIEADLVFLAMGFLGPRQRGPIKELGLALTDRGNIKTDEKMMTSVKNVFAAGDMRFGQSLIVRAIAEGRRMAHHLDRHLMGETSLPNSLELNVIR